MDKVIQHNIDVAEPFPAILTVHELALYLRLSEAMIYRLARAKKLPFVRIGKSMRFQKDQIDEWFHDLSLKSLETK
jgi:excisionase family DNA binding protein